MDTFGANNEIHYTLVSDEVAKKHEGLDVQAKLVLQIIEKAGSKGIWKRDIKFQTNIQQQSLDKIYKKLEQRCLIKRVKSINAKNKVLFMLYELTPSIEITGGVWYSSLEFDHAFISELRKFIIHCVRKINGGRGASISEIKRKLDQAEASKVELSYDDVELLVNTLVYDLKFEKVSTETNDETIYLWAKRVSSHCDFKWWDVLSPDFHFRSIKFEDGVVLSPHEPHHHTS